MSEQSKILQKTVERGKILLTYKYMTAHFPALEQALQ